MEINAAISYVDALGGGDVCLSWGTYDIADTIYPLSNIWLRGAGWGTVLKVSDSITCIIINGQASAKENITISNLNIDGNSRLGYHGIQCTYECMNITIQNNWVHHVEQLGICIFGGTDASYSKRILIAHNFCGPYNRDGIAGDDYHIEIDIIGNTCYLNADFGIGFARNIGRVNVVGNILLGNEQSYLGLDCYSILVSGNYSARNLAGFLVIDSGAHDINITGNFSEQDGVNVAVPQGTLRLGKGVATGYGATHDISITNNWFYCKKGAIEIDEAAYNIKISDNYITERFTNTTVWAIKITDGSHVTIIDNDIYGGSAGLRFAYGIEEVAPSDYNVIKGNRFRYISTAPVSISGAHTILESKPFRFTEAVTGSIVTTSPIGIDVDAIGEEALTWGQLPLEVQQVVRIKIWAVATGAPIGAGGQMHLEVTFNAGGSLEDYNLAGNSWNITDHDSEEADYAANKVVHWVIKDGDVGDKLLNLLGGDSFELKAIGEGGADPDGATDAVFGTIEIEYV